MIEPYQDVINEYGIDEPTIKYAVLLRSLKIKRALYELQIS
ncbi:hypothetical protein LMT8_09095 [Leuconostoc mesenteroides subsp. cremoris TIFN8]|nr:hypothetical protein LMT8_09095 [Leuconostoc mesenteroides subsp. cremoris TIFN8]